MDQLVDRDRVAGCEDHAVGEPAGEGCVDAHPLLFGAGGESQLDADHPFAAGRDDGRARFALGLRGTIYLMIPERIPFFVDHAKITAADG